MRVAGEQLVGPLPREHHLHVPARELGQQERRDRGVVGNRLVEVIDGPRQEPLDVHRVDDERVVLGSELARDAFGVRALVVRAGHAEADGEGLDRALGEARHQRHDAARVDAARQEGAERDVAQETAADGIAEQLAQGVHPALFRPVRSGLRGDVPVHPLRHARRARLEHRAGSQPHDVTKDRLPGRVVLKRQVRGQRLGAEFAARGGVPDQRLQLR